MLIIWTCSIWLGLCLRFVDIVFATETEVCFVRLQGQIEKE
jgi:hypothetical protein